MNCPSLQVILEMAFDPAPMYSVCIACHLEELPGALAPTAVSVFAQQSDYVLTH